MAITIKDIAKAANVSATTVSRVVNNRLVGISDTKREEIQKLILEMGYVPNSMARGLVTKKTNSLGLILPNIVDPFFAEIARGAQDAAEALGYFVIVINSDDDRIKEGKAIQLLKEKCVDGIMLYASGKLTLTEWYLLNEVTGNIPLILIGHIIANSSAPTVYLDYRKGMEKMTSYLIKKGHHKIVYMAGMSTLPKINEGLSGYISALNKYEKKLKPQLVCCGEFTLVGAKNVMQRLIGMGFPFTAVICENDLMAAGVLELLEENHIKVPEQVSVVGFDNTFFSRFTSPKLTTLDFPKYDMGKKAVDLVLEYVQNKLALKSSIELSGEIITRNSDSNLAQSNHPFSERGVL